MANSMLVFMFYEKDFEIWKSILLMKKHSHAYCMK